MATARLAVDKTVTLDINGSRQRVRMCAERSGLPAMLIVQAGPGLPLLHEVAKFRRRLQLETDFLVTYWDQRGCGNASQRDAKSVSMKQQVDDLRTVVRWLHNEAKQKVIVFGISLGATIVLQAAEHEPECVKSVVDVVQLAAGSIVRHRV
jgi:pimeloyl-ACP methyl ester carboxylesterase